MKSGRLELNYIFDCNNKTLDIMTQEVILAQKVPSGPCPAFCLCKEAAEILHI